MGDFFWTFLAYFSHYNLLNFPLNFCYNLFHSFVLNFNLLNTFMQKKKYQKFSVITYDNKPSNENILPFITIFYPNNLNIYSTIRSSVSCFKNNNISGFHTIHLIQSKLQSLNLKKLLTKAEFGEVLSSKFNCSDKRCIWYNYLLINDYYTFKNVQITFKLKNGFTWHKSNIKGGIYWTDKGKKLN